MMEIQKSDSYHSIQRILNVNHTNQYSLIALLLGETIRMIRWIMQRNLAASL